MKVKRINNWYGISYSFEGERWVHIDNGYIGDNLRRYEVYTRRFDGKRQVIFKCYRLNELKKFFEKYNNEKEIIKDFSEINV